MSDLKVSEASKAAAKALRQSNNEWSNKYFAIAIGMMMAVYAIYHWSSVIFFHYGPKKSHPTLNRIYRYIHFSHGPNGIGGLTLADKLDAFFLAHG
jgi:hypothetical protein